MHNGLPISDLVMFTVDSLIAHAVGDYLLQSHWMATEKVKRASAAAVHAVCYTLPFLFLTRSPAAFGVICGTHFVIDRWRLARYVCWAKNFLSPFHPDGGASVGFPAWFRAHPTARRLRPKPGGYRFALYSVNPPWPECSTTGYPPDTPVWLSVWLLIIADNIMHVLINGAALRWLG